MNIRNISHSTFQHVVRLTKTHKVGTAIVLVVCILVIVGLTKDAATPTRDVALPRAVTLASVADLSAHTTPLPLLGTVVSAHEAVVKAESSGMIRVYRKQGDLVTAGTVIAEFENSTERAGVLSAQGVYNSARAALASAKAGGSIASINSNTSGVNLQNTKTATINAINGIYATLDDAVRTKTDPMFSNPQQRDAKFLVSISDAKLLIAVEEEHRLVEDILRSREERNRQLTSTDDLLKELDTLQQEAEVIRGYLDDLSAALALAIPDQYVSRATIDGYKAIVSGARASVSGSFTSISGTRSALTASESSTAVAGASLTQSQTGSIAAAEAGVLSAEGALRAAEARLEKTMVRAPISGTINTLTLSTGDYVSPYTEVAVISNNGALEVEGYATADDARALRVGALVRINGTVASGVVTRVSQALDPKTKKIEFRVGIADGSASLINGQSVRLDVARSVVIVNDPKGVLRIPISALKITPQTAVVFTVNASSTLVAHPVTEGTLSGDEIEILKGLTPDMMIVVDARGLKEGQVVSVK